ncbi:MAG: bifunctional metallophosphatase/5'-nucleotidase [Myxococcota bacterium]
MARTSAWRAILLVLTACAHAPELPETGPVQVDVLSFNDFHGRLLPGSDRIGGAAELAAMVEAHRTPSSIVVSAGDLVGASPLISSYFHDEPTVEVMNALGLDILGIGNHEFDEGVAELRRIQRGGPHPSLQATDAGFSGSKFRYLSANTVDGNGNLLFDPHHVVDVQGVPVGFIAVTLKGTKNIVPPVLGDIEFLDEAEAVAKWARDLQQRGVEAIIVLLHEGGYQDGGPNDCKNFRGPAMDIVARLPSAVDVVLAGHTHQTFVCRSEEGPWVASGGAYGRYLTKVGLTISRRTRDVVDRSVRNIEVSDVGGTPEVAEIVERYQREVASIADREVGTVETPVLRDPVGTGESPLGSVIADAQRRATKADLAFMNLGGIRDDLGQGKPDVNYGDLFRIQPFDNLLVTKRFTGEQVLQILEAQWGGTTEHGLFQVSETLRYCYAPEAPRGRKVVRDSVSIRGRALDPQAVYVVALNSYLAQKPPFNRGRAPAVYGKDVDALVAYVEAKSPVEPPALGRICQSSRETTVGARAPASNQR